MNMRLNTPHKPIDDFNKNIVLGTAQFGLDYGIANQSGQVPAAEVKKIIHLAAKCQINMLDTAMAYGESESVLGKTDISSWQVISKLPAVPENCPDVLAWVERSVDTSLKNLNINKLDSLLLHRPTQLLEPIGKRLAEALCKIQASARVSRLGLSIYNFNELSLLINRLPCNVIQAPFSIFDQRLVQTGWGARLRNSGIEVHARSIFLQGLLLMPFNKRPAVFQRWSQTFAEWERWLEHACVAPLEACLRFALNSKDIDKVVVGIDSLNQLEQLLNIDHRPLQDLPRWQIPPSIDLLDPSRWNTL
jgi:aryl-alcohol dehydrogenase-like predicted oxidoreductase